MPRRVGLRGWHHPADRQLIARWIAGAFAGLLILVGVLGFVAPGRGSTTTAPAYNWFHVGFGVLGLALAVWGDGTAVRAFLLGFGAIDLYQALASSQGWFPASLFRWTSTDDLLHLVIGAGLVVAGVFL